MTLDLQFKIKNNPNYQRYIRENSHWYKLLNRNPALFSNFEEEVKEKYKLRPTDKIEKILETVEMVQAIVSTFH